MIAAARKYAKALLDVAQEEHVMDEVAADLVRISADGEFWRLVGNPRIRDAERESLLLKGCGTRVCGLTMSFLKLLGRKGRVRSLPDVAKVFQLMHDVVRGIRRGEVWTPMAMSDQEVHHVEQRMAHQMKGDVILTQVVEPSLLGGLTVVVNFRAYDGSARRQLDDLRLALIG